jgi:high affinity Mn2+ porin
LKRIIFLCGVFVFGLFGVCRADEEDFVAKLKQLEARVAALEEKVDRQDKCTTEQKQCILDQEKKIAEYESRLAQFDTDLHRQTGTPISIAEGLEIGVGGMMVVQGTNNVNNTAPDVEKKVSRTDVSYSADVTVGKEFKEIGGKAFLHLEAGRASGLEDDFTLYSNVNRDAGDSEDNAQVTESWYEQALCKDKAVLTFGKLDPTAYFDDNEVANDETTQFLARIFRNSCVIEFPDNTLGIRVAYLPWEWMELGYGIFDGDSDWEKMADNLFNIGQITLMTDFRDLPGNYRIYGWHNNSYHTKWLEPTKEKESAYGFGLSFDQKVCDIVTLFLRYGWQDPEVYNPGITSTGGDNFSLEHSWSVGFQLKGKPWGREKDVLAFGVGQIIPSDDYKKAGSSTVTAPNAKTEGHMEAYYRIFVNEHLSFSPDLQYIWNTFGKDVEDDTSGIFVGGLRAQVDF